MTKNKYLFPFILVCTLFFLWAFLHNINGILIPHLKKVCQLSDTQSSLIDFAVYFGYFVIAIPAGLFSHRFGYKKGILMGLFLFAAGALLFLPAADSRNFILFLVALFVAASGATFLETVANPYAAHMGAPETSEQRLNFAQSFNGLGAVVAPYIGSTFILSGVEHSKAELDAMKANSQLAAYLQHEASSIKPPYLIMAVVLVLVAIAFIFTKLPDVREEDGGGHGTGFSPKVLRIPHVRWAVIAEFFYVGAQVGVTSFFVRFSKFTAGIPEKTAGNMLGAAMIGFMAGRFLGTFFMRYIKPARLLSIYATINIGLLLVALMAHGRVAVYAMMAIPFFLSIMFPTIFALGIKDLGEETKMASSFLVMSIIGGAFTPVMMGLISDATGSIQVAYIMPVVCMAFILYFGLRGHRIKEVPQTQKTPALA
ncbi:L-fucose:H+ symporter permease [Puia dinghuensis]|uniref:L-fucose:H+ symporter permease n=1 Tax=Puia dinghuensis TaxID=1792502 RepID=A0A8J2XW61_9BACT|nr:L-fucose:H+ symporter permease [Puia dinghuensis]GGB21389.1 L-fucose:H+ symporter permease [Puia dinghuensis]